MDRRIDIFIYLGKIYSTDDFVLNFTTLGKVTLKKKTVFVDSTNSENGKNQTATWHYSSDGGVQK